MNTLRVNTTYVHFTDDAGSEEFDEREEFYFKAERQFNQYWSGMGYGRYDIDASDPLEYGIGFVYEDECFIFDGRCAVRSIRIRTWVNLTSSCSVWSSRPWASLLLQPDCKKR